MYINFQTILYTHNVIPSAYLSRAHVEAEKKTAAAKVRKSRGNPAKARFNHRAAAAAAEQLETDPLSFSAER